jgi:hypothetical protein
MNSFSRKLIQTCAAAAVALTSLAAIAAPASAFDGDRDHRVVRCERDGDRCVVLRCDNDRDECIRVKSFRRDRGEFWRRDFGFRAEERGWEDGGYVWYGPRHVHCNRFDRCRVVR